jgi:predicted transglutaminase-like cysteine proteinase
MSQRITALIIGLVCTSAAFAEGTDGKVLLDTWESAYLGEGKAGYVHTIATEIELDGKKVIHTTTELRLTVKRFSDTMEMAGDTGTMETPDGTVVGIFMRQFLGKKQQLQIDGRVVGKQIHLTLNGDTPLKPAPWRSDVLGLYKQETLFKDRDLTPGSKFSFNSFEPVINTVVKMEVVVKGEREVLLKGSKDKQKLLLVEVIPEKVEYARGPDKVEKIQLPIRQMWLDSKGVARKSEVEIPGLGPIVTYRTTKASAVAPGPPAQLTDLGFSQLVRLKSRLVNPHETTGAVYRITVRGDEDPASTFSRDERQQVKNAQGNSFELHVKAVKGSSGDGNGKEPGAEFIQSSYFITSDDARVQQLMKQATGPESDPWKKALRIERFVNQNMTFTNDETLATASHVARTLQGDCTEYAMLTAAMCRAAGVPSRTAIGLIYADVKGTPVFAFHMWTEVWARGRWIPLDATLGKGYIGAAHLKITDHSWHDERTMTPIFPVVRVVGRVSIDILSAEGR